MNILLVFLLCVAVILEGVQVSLPLVLVCLIGITIYRRDTAVFLLAFVSGFFLDAFLLRPFGTTSLFFLVFSLLLLLYQRKYEINTYQFVFFATLVGSGLYLMFFGYTVMWLQAGLSAFLGCFLLSIIRFLQQYKFSRGRESGLHYK